MALNAMFSQSEPNTFPFIELEVQTELKTKKVEKLLQNRQWSMVKTWVSDSVQILLVQDDSSKLRSYYLLARSLVKKKFKIYTLFPSGSNYLPGGYAKVHKAQNQTTFWLEMGRLKSKYVDNELVDQVTEQMIIFQLKGQEIYYSQIDLNTRSERRKSRKEDQIAVPIKSIEPSSNGFVLKTQYSLSEQKKGLINYALFYNWSPSGYVLSKKEFLPK
jgi:hypothetical protein